VNPTATGTDAAVAPSAAPVREPNRFTRRRLAKWNEPRRPRDWRYFVSAMGKVLIATGVLLFGFVAYQLWGTGLETARAQRALANEFEELLAAIDTAPTTTTPEAAPSPTVPDATAPSEQPTATAPPVSTPTAPVVQPIAPVSEGDPIARIEIPGIGVNDIVVAGVGVRDLQKGPGHFPDTPLPGQLGNAAIAGHRTTYGQPFRNVDKLRAGDEIVVTTLAGRFVYRVTGTQIVSPSDYQVVATTRPDVAEITLVSCHPVWSAAQRIIVSGVLDIEASSPPAAASSYLVDPSAPQQLPGEEPTAEGEPTATPNTTPVTTPNATPVTTPVTSPEPSAGNTVPPPTTAPSDTASAPIVADTVPTAVEDAFGRGWFHDDTAFAQVALWGIVLALISIGAYLVSRRARRDLVGFAVGVVPFVVAVFFFFQNVNRLLPPSL
jgi:sortase A